MYLHNNDELQLAQESSSPTTLDYLRPAMFRFDIMSLPRTSFTCQVASIPGLTIGSATQVTPTLDIPVIGDKLEFDPLTIEFMVNEDLSNYIELYNWIVAIASTELVNYTADDFRKAIANYSPAVNSPREDRSLYSDASLFILDGNNQPTAKINFLDIIPISIEGIPFDIRITSQDPVTARATFKYRLYNIEPL